jgi:hypothetical protein
MNACGVCRSQAQGVAAVVRTVAADSRAWCVAAERAGSFDRVLVEPCRNPTRGA